MISVSEWIIALSVILAVLAIAAAVGLGVYLFRSVGNSLLLTTVYGYYYFDTTYTLLIGINAGT